MTKKKLILRREWFGGTFVDTTTERSVLLSPEEYKAKNHELSHLQDGNAVVKLFDATEKGYPLRSDAVSSPMDMYIELTKKCNGSCKHCFVDSNSPAWSNEEILFSEIEGITRQFSDIGGFYVRLTGGEPTMRYDFFDILDLMNEERLIVALNTNGLYGEKKLERILSKGVKDIRVSLDGPEHVNDGIRGSGTYKHITQTLKNIAQYNSTVDEPVDATINVVLMKSNKDYIEEMIELAQGYNFNISFGLLRLSGRARREEMLSPEEVVQAAYKAQRTRERLGLDKRKVRINYDIFCESKPLEKFAPFPFDNSKCPIGVHGIGIDAYGRIVPCNYLVTVDNGRWLGEDVRGKDMLDLWYNSEVLNEARQATRECCGGCEYHIAKCNGGCPAVAYVSEGNIDGRDPYCIRDVNFSIDEKGVLNIKELV